MEKHKGESQVSSLKIIHRYGRSGDCSNRSVSYYKVTELRCVFMWLLMRYVDERQIPVIRTLVIVIVERWW